jgi:catechol 2,3-dioxygenase-like lactoylglutathione lyase family enzyme
MWLGVVHTGFTVSDLDRSVRWYEDVLGLELIKRQLSDNSYTRTIVGMKDAILDIAFLGFPQGSGAPAGQVLELMSYVSPKGDRIDLSTCNVGVGHVALRVADLRREYERLLRFGVEFRNPPVEIDAGLNRGGFACYMRDPDGITIELIQPTSSSDNGLSVQHPSCGS